MCGRRTHHIAVTAGMPYGCQMVHPPKVPHMSLPRAGCVQSDVLKLTSSAEKAEPAIERSTAGCRVRHREGSCSHGGPHRRVRALAGLYGRSWSLGGCCWLISVRNPAFNPEWCDFLWFTHGADEREDLSLGTTAYWRGRCSRKIQDLRKLNTCK